MKKQFFVVGAGLLFLAAVSSFSSNASGSADPADSLLFRTPKNFPAPVYNFQGNHLTEAGFKLGRKLFYDPILSSDKSISCANCHQQFASFAQLDHPVSHGVDDCLGTRNTPTLINLAWEKEFMWDGGVNHIEISSMNALTNPCEMANNLPEIVKRLKQSESYPALFKQVFQTDEINSQLFFKAITQFIGTLVSANSKYDQVIRHENGAKFTDPELSGYALFKTNCAACHSEPLFTDQSYRNKGLDLKSDDAGRDSITHLASDHGKFRVPTLRNVEVSSPYMHDGRFNTLEEVLEHYNSGVHNAPNLDPLLKQNGHLGISLNKQQQSQLIAFLKTLTDRQFLNNDLFKEPK
ncbi:cytochrome-c peroxidase [Mucilaginibacter pocheonensis]|uniref:Cytochrome c peroxidase n=1 Tax=Mucilaginibacter pocheonensis TaxID=398050 RepID=A0ABU1TED2_9SPHI|nr:cytochrome c peroxidase [Mucilaginibacter pocheonensis]MDR6943764.1 cytochrome c peroxidase [Mucilaginibacter pocheonensis]